MTDIFAKLMARAQEIEKAIEASAAHHHGLLGSYNEVKMMLSTIQPVINSISPQVGSVIEEGLDVVNTIATAINEGVSTPQSNE